MLDIPKYKLNPRSERFMLSHILLLVLLGVLLYLGIYANYYLLALEIPELLNGIFVVSILLLLIIDALLCCLKFGRYEYALHNNRLEFNHGSVERIYYRDVADIGYTKNMIDDWMRTGTIILHLKDGGSFRILHLSNVNQIHFWLQKKIRESQT